jgi:hypothetical protein
MAFFIVTTMKISILHTQKLFMIFKLKSHL